MLLLGLLVLALCYGVCFLCACVIRRVGDRKDERALVTEIEQFLKDNTRLDT